MKKIE